MNNMINIRWLLLLFVITVSSSAFGQGIRKDYTEMTNDERVALIDAYWAMGSLVIGETESPGGLIGEIGNFHGNNFNDIHENGPSRDVFLPWHRQASVELERMMKNGLDNEWITIPYWDWTISNSKDNPLWGDDWLGPFDSSWQLGRTEVDAGGAPVQDDIDFALTETNFSTFTSDRLEINNLHFWGHTWTRGIMVTPQSPKDPAFFLHHNMVDKIWADWYDMHGSPDSDYFIKTDMPRYPDVDPESIVDPRSLGIFYSDRVNSITTLDKYTVSNAKTDSEKFGYQFRINSGDNFLVPFNGGAEFRSCNVIELQPGFEAAKGSVFEADIDSDCNFSTSALVVDNSGSDEADNANSALEKTSEDAKVSVKSYPNPFKGQATIEFTLTEDTAVTLFVSDVTGKQIAVLLDNEQQTTGTHQVTFDGTSYPTGMYYYTIQAGEYVGTQKMTLVK